MANKVLGMHRLKNKVNRNAFDLSHRHMLLPKLVNCCQYLRSGLILMRRLKLGIMVRPVPLPLILMRLLVFVKIYSIILFLFSLFGSILSNKLIIWRRCSSECGLDCRFWSYIADHVEFTFLCVCKEVFEYIQIE